MRAGPEAPVDFVAGSQQRVAIGFSSQVHYNLLKHKGRNPENEGD